jgi:hypothetical protein
MRRGSALAQLSKGVVFLIAAGCSADEKPAFSRAALLTPETCRECHEDHYVEWSGSMHAYASTDPVFLAMNARGQRETDGKLADFCVRCHAPMAVNEGATTDGLNLEELPPELQGVTCYFCHNAASIEDTHNNPITLSNDTTMRGNFRDPAKTSAHNAEYSALLDGNDITESSRLCGTCHDIVVPRKLSGGAEDVHLERTFKEWDESLFSIGPRGRLSCARCHMRSEAGVPVASAPGSKSRLHRHTHDFPAVDVALTPFPEMERQRAAVERLLDTSVRVEVCATLRNTVTVQLDNTGAGHNMPSGAAQDRRLWVELQVFERPGDTTPVYEAGIPPASGDIDALADRDDTWILRDRAFDATGNETHMFWKVATTEAATLLAPITTSIFEPGYHREVITKNYEWIPRITNRGYPARIAVTLKMTPVAKAVLNDLVASRDLSEKLAAEVPTFSLVPNHGRGDSTTIEWTFDDSFPGGAQQDLRCVETAAGR